MRYIRWHRRPCVEATTCPTAARSTAVVICVHTGDAVSRILVVWWKREAICGAGRLNKSASLLTTCIVFRVAAGEPIFRYGKCFSGLLTACRAALLTAVREFRVASGEQETPNSQNN